MSHLLSLQPQGLETSDVEGLASYFVRLAAHHCVSPFQFANYLRERNQNLAIGMRTPGNLSGKTLHLLSGFGVSARATVEWLNDGLLRNDMAALTILIFKDVLPANGACALRERRAWCPACLKEMQDQGGVVYEKLLWQIRLMTRCTLHEVRLETVCPRCAREQFDYPGPGRDFARCLHCDESLIGTPTSWQLVPKSCAGEVDLLEIVRRSSSAPGFRYPKSAPHTFLNRYVSKSRDPRALRAVIYRAGIKFKFFQNPDYSPALDTLVSLSLITEVPLHLILEFPIKAAGIAQLEPKFAAKVVPKPRAFRAKGKRAHFKAALIRELKKGDGLLPIPLKRLCQKFGIGVPTALYWEPARAEKLIVKYKEMMATLKEQRASEARRLIQEKGLPKYRSGEFKSQKEMIDWLRSESGISKGAFYRELAAQLRHGKNQGCHAVPDG